MFEEPGELIYLDAARRMEFETPTEIVNEQTTGVPGVLTHLEGMEVSVLGDGAEQGNVRVIDGQVTLNPPARKVVIGLPFTSELQPMRMEISLPDGTAQHRLWRMSRVGMYVHESLGGEIADGPNGRFEVLSYRRVATPMGAAPALYSGEMETAIESHAREGADVVIRQRAPLPLNVASITLKGDIYGE
jgi:hypothetical protein